MQYQGQSTLALEREYETRRRLYNYEDLSRHKVAVVGLGVTGLPLTLSIAQKGYDVIGFDFDPATVSAAQTALTLHFGADELSLNKKLPPLSSAFKDLRSADTFLLSLSIPTITEGTADFMPVLEQLRIVAAALRHGSLLLLESPLSPGMSEDIIIPVLEYESDLMVERDFFYVHCPPRADHHLAHHRLPRVIGGAGPLSLERGINVYDSICDAPLIPMATLKETEAYYLE